MISRGLIRRLERIERALSPNPVPFLHLEFYLKQENGTLIHLDRGGNRQNDARKRIRVVFVDPAGKQKSAVQI